MYTFEKESLLYDLKRAYTKVNNLEISNVLWERGSNFHKMHNDWACIIRGKSLDLKIHSEK